MVEETRKTPISESVAGKICTLKFFDESELPKQYYVVSLSKKTYGIIKNSHINYVVVSFTNISKIKENVYLVDCDDGKKCLLGIADDKLVISDSFYIIIKVLNEYTLVEKADGKRMLIDDRYALSNGSLRSFEWYSHFGKKYEVFDAPNGEKVVIARDGLKISGGKYIAINKCLGRRNINDKFVIARRTEDAKMVVIRTCDLKESEPYLLIKVMYPYDGVISTEYVEVYLEDVKKIALMRIEDFELSRPYDEIHLLSADYAKVKSGGTQKIMKLDDFSVAKWVKDE